MSSTPPNMPPTTPPGGSIRPRSRPTIPRPSGGSTGSSRKPHGARSAMPGRPSVDAMKASYVGAYGPRVPSVVGPIILIAVGVIALLLVTGHINSGQFWSWYGHWWPLLLIGAGLALLAEWAMDLTRETPVRRGGSFVGILILLALLGFGAAGWNHARPWFTIGMATATISSTPSALPEHDMEQQLLSQQIPANAAIQIENPRGDVSITAGDGSAIQVQAHEVAYANSDSEAKKIFDAVAAHLTASGNSVLVQVGEQLQRTSEPDHHRAQDRQGDGKRRQGRRDRLRPGRGDHCHRPR